MKEAASGRDTDGILQKNPFRYRCYYYDVETGFYYLNARYYDPKVRRFISADSVVTNTGEDVLGYNLYAYCNNSPLNKTDSSGHAPKLSEVFRNIAIAAGVVALVALTVASGGGTAPLLAGYLSVGVSTVTAAATATAVAATATSAVYSTAATGAAIWETVGDSGLNKHEAKGKKTSKPLDKVNYNSKQVGKKWGKHKFDYPKMKNYNDYVKYAEDVFNSPEKIISDVKNKEYLYIKGKDLLRIGENGEFISLYHGAESSQVLNAIIQGGMIWP